MKLNYDCMRECLLYLESAENVRISSFEGELDISLEPIFIEQLFADHCRQLKGISSKQA